MPRIVEDCIVKIPNRFELIAMASKRARDITTGAALTIERDNNKNPVVALREIADETITLKELKEILIKGLQSYSEGFTQLLRRRRFLFVTLAPPLLGLRERFAPIVHLFVDKLFRRDQVLGPNGAKNLLVLLDDRFAVPEVEDHHVFHRLQGFDDRKHLELQDRAMGRVNERTMKADVRCAEFLIDQRLVFLQLDFRRHAVQLGIGSPLDCQSDADKLKLVPSFGNFGKSKDAEGNHQGNGCFEIFRHFFGAGCGDERAAAGAAPGTDQTFRGKALQCFPNSRARHTELPRKLFFRRQFVVNPQSAVRYGLPNLFRNLIGDALRYNGFIFYSHFSFPGYFIKSILPSPKEIRQ